jgi:hypothetical protein
MQVRGHTSHIYALGGSFIINFIHLKLFSQVFTANMSQEFY